MLVWTSFSNPFPKLEDLSGADPEPKGSADLITQAMNNVGSIRGEGKENVERLVRYY